MASKTKKPGTKVTPANPELDFKKPNEAIGLRVSEGRLTLLARKIFNIMVLYAQKSKVPGVDAPIDTPAAKKYFWISLSDIVKDTNYNSRDIELIKSNVEDMQNIRIHLEDDLQWTSEVLISGVKIVNPAGLNKKGGRLWLGYQFPPEMMEMVMNPKIFTSMSAYYQTMIRSGPTLALYEICRRYATNPSHLTSRDHWSKWYGALSGTPVSADLPEYKYFKRDILKPSIAETNAITDIEIELIEHKQGRKIIDLQFRVHLRAQQNLDLPGPPIVDGEFIHKLVKLGIGQEEAQNLYASSEEELLKATLKMTEARMNNNDMPKLISPAAFFKDALRKRYAEKKSLEDKVAKSKSEPKKPSLKDRYMVEQRKSALGYFNEIDQDGRETLEEEYLKVMPKHLAPYYQKGGIETPIVKSAFSEWLALRLWGEPTDKQLLEFAEQQV